MGDGTIGKKEGKNQRVQANMTNSEYLRHVDKQFGILGTGVSLYQTAKECANSASESGFSPNAKEKNYSDQYSWRTRCHPDIQEFAKWYASGKKVWPEDIELTPTVLKHWYCGDGCLASTKNTYYIKISMSNESENTDKVDSLFENSGIPSPNRYDMYKRRNGSIKCGAIFTTDQTKELLKYMGSPPPGFEYKWTKDYK